MQPLRCWTCGKSLHRQTAEFKACVKSGMPPAQALDHLGLLRYCCRCFPITAVSTPAMLLSVPEDAPSGARLTQESRASPTSTRRH
jgi:DNA-directed RNA polymerase subunit N (RpoN/RPB10)